MIELSNGHRFEYMAASGALAYDGTGWWWEQPLRWAGLLQPELFTTVIKTLTRHPRKGNLRVYNPFRVIRLLRGGVVNAVGLTNPGIDAYCQTYGLRLRTSRLNLVASVFGEPREIMEMVERLNEYPFQALEFNASCPNTEQDVLENSDKIFETCYLLQKSCRFPVILKLSVVHDYLSIVKEVEDCIEAVAINSVPWQVAFVNRRSPLEQFGGGGVSGKVAQPHTWVMVRDLAKHTNTPVIGPSAWEFEDIEKLRKLGASTISFGSIFLPYPWRPTKFVRMDMEKASSL